jgi:PAS domain-containing protein
MKDQSETKKQLLAELEGLRREIERLRQAEAKHKRTAGKPKEGGRKFRLIFGRSPKAKEALRYSEGAKTAIFDAMTEFVIFQDRDHRVLWANQAALEAARTGPEEIIGRRCHEALSRSETECPGCPVAEAFATRQFAEATVTTLHDRVRLVRANPVPDHQGDVSGVVVVSLDITAQKKAEQEKERLILELKRALGEVKKLSGLLPICASCKKIRNDQGYWEQIESYISSRTEVDFSHGICPDCKRKLYPELDKHKLEPLE